MALFKVLQNHAIEAHSDEVNALGWSDAAVLFPAVHAYLETRHGSNGWKPAMLDHYKAVAVVNAADLEAVFRVMNGDDIGKEAGNVMALGKFWSLSVGDIVETTDGDLYMVDPIGFERIARD